MASLARTSLGPRTDRTAAHAAVRNLAESYGVDLLPLELNTSLSITPLKPQSSIARRSSCELPRTVSLQDEVHDSIAAGEPSGTSTSVSNDLDKAAVEDEVTSPARHSVPVTQIAADCTADLSASPASSDDSMPASETAPLEAAGHSAVAVSQPAEAPWIANPTYLSEEEYLQYQIPLEQQLQMLEEERDILVDKLLATTEALHASEARNRENQASASQVSALLDQLQELLRRAEVERDKAKMQLKRQRMSASQISASGSGGSAVVAQLAAAAPMPAPVPQQQQSVSAADDSETQSQDANSSTNNNATGHNAPQRWLKKHKSNCGNTSSNSLAVWDAEPAAGGESSTDALLLPSRQDSSSSSEGSCSGVDQVQGADADGAAVTLTPSSNEVRPPVSRIISGFESLARQKRRQAAAKAAAAAAAAASRRGSGIGTAASAHLQLSASPASAESSGEWVLPAATAAAAAMTVDDGTAAAGVTQEAAAAGAIAAAPQVLQGDDCSSHSSLILQQQVESSSLASTPTAAAVYNASPTAFAAEAAEAAGEPCSLKPIVAASYAEVTKRDSNGSTSRDSSRSPTKRAVRSSCKPESTCSAAAAEHVQGSGSSSSFEFGSKPQQGSSSSRPRCEPEVPGKHDDDEVGTSNVTQAAAAASTHTSSHSQQQQQQQQKKQSQLYDPAKLVAVMETQQQQEQEAPQGSHMGKDDGLKKQGSSAAQGRSSNATSTGAAVQAVDSLGDCTAEIRAAGAAAAVQSSSCSSDAAENSRHQSSNSSSSSPRKKHNICRKQQQEQCQETDAKLNTQSTQVESAAVPPNGLGRFEALSSAQSQQPRRSLLFTVAVVCLLAGSLLQGFVVPSLLRRQNLSSGLEDSRQLAQLQAKLTATQQKVQILEQQLSDKSLACKLCEKGSVPKNSEL